MTQPTRAKARFSRVPARDATPCSTHPTIACARCSREFFGSHSEPATGIEVRIERADDQHLLRKCGRVSPDVGRDLNVPEK